MGFPEVVRTPWQWVTKSQELMLSGRDQFAGATIGEVVEPGRTETIVLNVN